MINTNPIFPVFQRAELKSSSSLIAQSLRDVGVCYVTGFDENINIIKQEFFDLEVPTTGIVKVLSPDTAKNKAPNSHSILYSPEFNKVKRKILGPLYNNEIEIFCQHTLAQKCPPSGILHFDKRPTFKVWIYLNNIGPDQGPMRVVPNSLFPELSPLELRRSIGTRKLFQGDSNIHHAAPDFLDKLENSAQYITGGCGTVFIHYTESWHAATPVQDGCHRTIMRSPSRSALNFLQR